MIDTSLFPYSSFPIRLEYDDTSGKIICFFSCEDHLEKHLERYKLNKKKVIILRRPEDWIDLTPIISSQSTPSKPKKRMLATKRKLRKKNV